jgi:hypothetical protein
MNPPSSSAHPGDTLLTSADPSFRADSSVLSVRDSAQGQGRDAATVGPALLRAEVPSLDYWLDLNA